MKVLCVSIQPFFQARVPYGCGFYFYLSLGPTLFSHGENCSSLS